jgi:hypothetical protein
VIYVCIFAFFPLFHRLSKTLKKKCRDLQIHLKSGSKSASDWRKIQMIFHSESCNFYFFFLQEQPIGAYMTAEQYAKHGAVYIFSSECDGCTLLPDMNPTDDPDVPAREQVPDISYMIVTAGVESNGGDVISGDDDDDDDLLEVDVVASVPYSLFLFLFLSPYLGLSSFSFSFIHFFVIS